MRFRHAGASAPWGNRVIGCWFSDCGYGFLDDLTGVFEYPGGIAGKNIFVGNMADTCQSNGFLFIRQQGSVIIGNTALNNNISGVTLSTRGGIGLADYCLNNAISGNVCDDDQQIKTQTYGLYIYPTSISGASVKNAGNRVEHRSIYGSDYYFPSVQNGMGSATILNGKRVVIGTVTFPTEFEAEPIVTAGLQNANAFADDERPASVAVYNVTAYGFAFIIDTTQPVAANRLLSIGWRAFSQ